MGLFHGTGARNRPQMTWCLTWHEALGALDPCSLGERTERTSRSAVSWALENVPYQMRCTAMGLLITGPPSTFLIQ